MKLKISARLLLLAYTLFMLYLMLFGRIGTVSFDSYSQYLSEHFSILPFRFVVDYLKSVPVNGIYNVEMRNIIGNIFLFFPFGILVPTAFGRLRRFGAFIATFALTIAAIELLQLFLALGSLDIDDLLLNCTGAAVGFLVYRAASRNN